MLNQNSSVVSDISVFDNPDFGKVRTMMIDGDIWFVGKDVASILGYSNPRKALADHVDDEDKNTVTIRDGIGNPNKTVINESGIYSLILSSKLPTAKQFKRWVTSEILPTLRKTGGYINNNQLFLDTYFSDVDPTQRAIIESCMNQIIEKQKKINSMQPKYDYCNQILQSENAITITAIAKDYGMTAYQMNQLLNECDVQYKVGGMWVLYKTYANKGYTVSKTGVTSNEQYTYMHTYWTQKGRYFIYNLLKKKGVLPLIEQHN